MLSIQQQKEQVRIRAKLIRIMNEYPEWDCAKVARTLLLADNTINRSFHTLSRLAAQLQGEQMNIKDIKSVRSLIKDI